MKKIRPGSPPRSARVAAIAFLLVSLGHPLRAQRPDPSDWRSERDPVPQVSPFLKNSEIDRALSWLYAADRALEPWKAIENYEKALLAFRALNLRSMEADILKRLGFTYASVTRYEKAIDSYEQALAIERGARDHAGQAATLNRLGLLYVSSSRYGKAIDSYEQALAIERKAGDCPGAGATLNELGETYRSLSQYAKAIGFYEEALAIQREAGDRKGESRTLNGLGEVYRSMGQYAKAIGFYEQALAIVVEAGDRAGEGATLNNLGTAATSKSQYAKAIGFYDQALAIEREAGNRKGEGASLNDLGAIYYLLGQYPRAIGFYEQALAIRRDVRDRAGEGATLHNLGGANDALGYQAKAIDFYDQALFIRREARDRAGEGATLNNLAGTYYGRSQYAKAIGFYEQSLAIMIEVGDRAGEGATLNNLGKSYAALSQYAKANEFFEQALPIRREVGDRAGEGMTLSNLMHILSSQGRPRLAVLFGKQAVNAYQQIRQELVGLDRDTRKTYLESKEYTYRGLADLLLAQDRIAEAQQVLNLLKEEEFFDFIRRDSQQSPSLAGRADLTPAEADWNRGYNEIAGRLTELGRERGDLMALRTRTAEQDARLASLDRDLTLAFKAFQKFLAGLDTEAAQQKLSKEKLEQVEDSEALMETLRELGAGTVAIYTLVTEDKLRLILITPNVIKTSEAAITRTDLNTKIVAFRQSLENPRSDPRPMARELYKLIVGPIEKDLAGAKAGTLMWSLDLALRYLPVAALHDGDHYLVETFRNVVFTPASNANLKDVPAVEWRALGLGVSKPHEGFGPLPGAQKELEAIIHDEATGTHGILPGAIELDEAFTEQSMLTALRQHYRVVHIASHFRFKPGNETDSYLLLGDGGHMSLADVGMMVNPFGGVDLLTLSACDTAIGGTGANGKEVEGFGVLAQRKGAKAVIATLWPVADASTNELMQTFYQIRESKPGTTKAEALRQAQLELLNGSVKFGGGPAAPYTHPYYWAPFILIGNWR
jgi:CHAT domain-containing protein/tetratricopeptide (TPR) repeat protein